MAHPYYSKKAAEVIARAGGNPAVCAPLADWAEKARNSGRSRTDGVLVAEDGSLIAETFRNVGKVTADYLASDDAARFGLAGNVADLAIPQIEQQIGQKVIQVHVSDVTLGSAPKISETITPETVINSPRQIATGQGAWTGTVREAFAAEYQNSTGTALGDLEQRLRDEGKLPELPEDEADTDETHTFNLDRDAHLLTIEHLRDLLDDPNAEIIA